MIVSKHACPSKIPHPLLNQEVSVQCVDTDLASNLAIIPGIQLKIVFSDQFPRSIILSHKGENFQSALPSQLFESSCMGLCFDQSFFEIFNQEHKHCHIIGENALHFLFKSWVMNNIFQSINLSYGWLEKVYKDQFHLFSIFEQQMGLISFSVSLHYNSSPFDFPIFSAVNGIECPSRVERRKQIIVWSG